MKVDLFLFAGEASGDKLGAALTKKLLQKRPSLRIAGVGGKHMRQEGVYSLLKSESFQVMGFFDIFIALPRLAYLLWKVKKVILKTQPEVVVLIDYAEFNLLLAKRLRKSGYRGKIIQYVCPSIWAWRKKRKQTLEAYFDAVLCLFPFEPKLFSDSKLDAYFVGHPLVSQQRTPLNSASEKQTLAIFPGSRKSVIKRNLPLQIAAIEKLGLQEQFQIEISCAHRSLLELLESITQGRYRITPPGDVQELMQRAAYAISTSGTITLELALHKTPTVVTYKMHPLDIILARDVFKIILPHYCIVNIILEKSVFPELYGPMLSLESLTGAVGRLVHPSDAEREKIHGALGELKDSMGSHDVDAEVASIVYSALSSRGV